MPQPIALSPTNEDLDNLQRLKKKWPRWDDEQLLRMALAIAANTIKSEAPQEDQPASEFERTVKELYGD